MKWVPWAANALAHPSLLPIALATFVSVAGPGGIAEFGRNAMGQSQENDFGLFGQQFGAWLAEVQSPGGGQVAEPRKHTGDGLAGVFAERGAEGVEF